jgi:hypothetical protein
VPENVGCSLTHKGTFMIIGALESAVVRAGVRYPTLPFVAEPVANRSRAYIVEAPFNVSQPHDAMG